MYGRTLNLDPVHILKAGSTFSPFSGSGFSPKGTRIISLSDPSKRGAMGGGGGGGGFQKCISVTFGGYGLGHGTLIPVVTVPFAV